MNVGVIIVIMLLLVGAYYTYTHPEITKFNPFSKDIIQNLTISPQNNTPLSIITYTPDKTYFGKPFAYYNCAEGGGDNSCKLAFGSGVFCMTNQSDSRYGQCYANR